SRISVVNAADVILWALPWVSHFAAQRFKEGGFRQGPSIVDKWAEICPVAMDSGWARIAKPVHSVANETGSSSRHGEKHDGERIDGLDGSWAGRQVSSGCEADFPLGHPGAGPLADVAARTRPRAGTQYRGLHLRLSRLAARHVRPRPVARKNLPQAA